MVDPGRLRALLDRLSREVDALIRLSALTEDELVADPERLPGIKYRFIVAIEACIDIADHVIASEGLRSPATFADAFESLAEGGFLDPALVAPMKAMAGFRNLLVHEYRVIDNERVVEILRTKIQDLERFLEAASGFN